METDVKQDKSGDVMPESPRVALASLICELCKRLRGQCIGTAERERASWQILEVELNAT